MIIFIHISTFFRSKMVLWILGLLLQMAVGFIVVFIIWIKLSVGICKSKKRLNGKVNALACKAC
jgi:uncharacterized membrane protein